MCSDQEADYTVVGTSGDCVSNSVSDSVFPMDLVSTQELPDTHALQFATHSSKH